MKNFIYRILFFRGTVGRKLFLELEESRNKEKQLQEALNVIPPHKLRMLADWLDIQDTRVEGMTNIKKGREVQSDLRKMAELSEAVIKSKTT